MRRAPSSNSNRDPTCFWPTDGNCAVKERRILIINGHPDPARERLCAALCDAYAEAAVDAHHSVRRLDVASLEFPLIRTAAAFIDGAPPPDIVKAQEAVRWSEHIVLVHPLWLGGLPALTKGFLEQVFRYGFALGAPGSGKRGLLSGRTARLVVTMGMPGPIYRLVFGAFGVRSTGRSIFSLAGIRPVKRTLLGMVAGDPPARQAAMLARMRRLGSLAA